ncbi:MAG: dihydropteroate synthase [Actinomycetota bacterium]|nr:dihydropteroate synthase [Actinomycetota bacterium]
METMLSSASREVVVGGERPTVLIGERINPSGKKWLKEALMKDDLDVVRREAVAQAEAGADVLDVNVGVFGIDEKAMLPRVVETVMGAVDLPLCIDTTDSAALQAALEAYDGKPLVNSVTGEEASLSSVLPLVKEYGAAVVGLVQDDEGIPKDAVRRFQIAEKILRRAEDAGIPRQDVIIDCLVFSVGSDTSSGSQVLEAIRRVRGELGLNVTLGLSNISFGLPDRDLINGAFAAMAVLAGAGCLIVDVEKVRPCVLAADLVAGKDSHARRYLADYRRRK